MNLAKFSTDFYIFYLIKKILLLAGFSILLLITVEKVSQAIVVSGDPSNDSFGGPDFDPDDPYYVVEPGESDPVSGVNFDGVSDLIIDSTSRCTGSRIGSNIVLTAAHCVTDDNGNLTANNVDAFWETDDGDFSTSSTDINVHPNWNGGFFNGADVAVLEMANDISSFVPTYDLFLNSTEKGKTFTKVGYGRSGNGNDGDIISSGTKRQGQNIYDRTGADFSNVDDGVLFSDFDNDTSTNNVYEGTGIGYEEINAAPGDSGGPNFINGQVAGITSFGTRTGSPPDVDSQINSTFGELSGDARVSEYSNFIQSFNSTPVPFEAEGSMGLVALGGFFFYRYRKKRKQALSEQKGD